MSDDRTFDRIWGWNCPPLSRHDIANIAFLSSLKIRSYTEDKLPEEARRILSEVQERVDFVISSTVPQLPGGNSPLALAVIAQLCDWSTRNLPVLPPSKVSLDWKEAGEKKLVPTDLARRLRSLEASLTKLEPRTANLNDQMKTISDAHATAENLPALLDDLEEARGQISDVRKFIDQSSQTITDSLERSDEHLARMAGQDSAAERLLANLGDAYRATTTKGLAASFQSKAKTLNLTLLLWTIGLGTALAGGAYIATLGIDAVKILLRDKDVSTDRMVVQMLVSLAGIGGPVWFAWIATKQIGQRFRLAEDYGFKASVAKAYEGYKLEAVRLDKKRDASSADENFEKRLFASALTRLEEAPLRLIETETPGSPWHELIRSTGFIRALETLPELRNELTGILSTVPAAMLATAERKTASGKRSSAANESGEDESDAA